MKLAIPTGTVGWWSKGWTTFRPVSKPSFSADSISASEVPPLRHSAMKAATFASPAASSSASGWSGATATKLAPYRVSGRVV